MSLFFNMLSKFVIAFLPKSKCLLISWLQSPSAVILEPKKIKSATVSIASLFICHEVMGPDATISLNFEHYFAGMWDECNCAVLGTFFGIAFLWDWNENCLFQSCGHCWVFQIRWFIECSTFTVSSFRIWNRSTGFPSPPLALFTVMFPKAHLTS